MPACQQQGGRPSYHLQARLTTISIVTKIALPVGSRAPANAPPAKCGADSGRRREGAGERPRRQSRGKWRQRGTRRCQQQAGHYRATNQHYGGGRDVSSVPVGSVVPGIDTRVWENGRGFRVGVPLHDWGPCPIAAMWPLLPKVCVGTGLRGSGRCDEVRTQSIVVE